MPATTAPEIRAVTANWACLDEVAHSNHDMTPRSSLGGNGAFPRSSVATYLKSSSLVSLRPLDGPLDRRFIVNSYHFVYFAGTLELSRLL